MIYIQSQPDYLPQRYSPSYYTRSLNVLAKLRADEVLYLDENGLQATNKAIKIWEWFKGCLGFENHTDEARINCEILKLLFYGVASSSNTEANFVRLKTIKSALDQQNIQLYDSVKAAVDRILQLPEKKSSRNATLLQFHQDLFSFYNAHQSRLIPSFWNQYFSETIQLVGTEFGDTYISLAYKRLKENTNDETSLKDALNCCLLASQDFNSSSEQYLDRLMGLRNEIIEKNESISPQQLLDKIDFHLALCCYKHKCYEDASQLLETVYNRQDRLYQPQDLRDDQREVMAEICMLIADRKANPTSFLSSFRYKLSFNHHKNPKDISAKYYILALNFSIEGQRESIFAKIKEWITDKKPHIKPALFQQLAEQFKQENDWFSELYSYVVAFQLSKQQSTNQLFSRDDTFYIPCISNLIANLYKKLNKETSSFLLQAIDWTLSIRGNLTISHIAATQITHRITSLFSPKIPSLEGNIPPHLYDIIEEQPTQKGTTDQGKPYTRQGYKVGKFKYNVGAELHFFKAEILRQSGEESTAKECLDHYIWAYKLAPNHPFGCEAIFMEDDQLSIDTETIETYRSLAIECKAPHISMENLTQ